MKMSGVSSSSFLKKKQNNNNTTTATATTGNNTNNNILSLTPTTITTNNNNMAPHYLATVPEEDNPSRNNNYIFSSNNSTNEEEKIEEQVYFKEDEDGHEEDRRSSSLSGGGGFSPGVFLSPPTLASTPSIPRLYSTSSLTSQFELFDLSYSGVESREPPKRQKQNSFPLTQFPLLILNKIFGYLTDKDLRRFHQVSHAWKATLESRVGDNTRRLELVRKIRENKENMLNGSQEQPTPDSNRVNRERVSDKKSEDIVLMECTNVMNTSNASSTRADSRTGNSFLTPTSRFPFQSFEEAEKSLKKGQKLFRCRRCSGPVPSPILAGDGYEEKETDASKHKIEATRCRLFTPDNSRKLRKKRSIILEPSTSMPPPMSPIDIPTTLSERMSECLVISGATSSPFGHNRNLEEARNTPSDCRIDLHTSGRSEVSSIDIKLNFTNSFDTSFSSLLISPLSNQWKDSQHSIAESCLSDNDLSSHDIQSNCSRGKSSLFPNLILSPEFETNLQFSSNQIRKVPTIVEKDFMKPNTLIISSSEGSVPNGSKPHDKNDIIESSTYESHSKSINDINSMHEKSLIIIDSDRDGQKFTNLIDVSRSLIQLPSLSLEGTDKCSRSTSDYFSSCSILRDGSKSYFPEISSGRYEMARRSLNESAICKTQSLGNMSDDRGITSRSVFSESSVSCPDLNDSFVLECPNPNCSYRFCSTCSMAEHPGRPCHIINSESFEELNESKENKYLFNVSQSSNNMNKSNQIESLGKGKGKKGSSNTIYKDKSSKSSLRRIAKL